MAAPAVPSASLRSTSLPGVDAAAWVWRLRHGIVCALLTAVALNSDPGLQVADTKLDLVVNPVGLLERGLHLWDPTGAAGQLQDQAYGYLFPMGPFFALGHAVGIPGWVVQRFWWGLLLAVGYLGFVALTRRLALGSEWTRLVTGVGFALAPERPGEPVPVLGRGLAARPGRVGARPAGRCLRMRAPAPGGRAVRCRGALHGRRQRHGRPRRAPAGRAVVPHPPLVPGVARAWPSGGRSPSSPPRCGGWCRCWPWAVTALRSSVHRAGVGHHQHDHPRRGAAGHGRLGVVPRRQRVARRLALLTHPLLIVYTVLLAALGLGGLAWRRTNERLWLVLMLVVGVTLVALGHIGPVDGFFAADLRGALDHALAPLRNIHKFDILIRLALAAGAAAALDGLSRGRTEAETRFLRPSWR